MQVFENTEFGKVRVVEIDGQPWFIGKDVADILGYTNSRKALITHVDTEDKLAYRFVTSGQNRSMTAINESGLYSLILSSKLPQAKAFKRWITSEVLPAIRKHGAYITEETLEKMLGSNEFAKSLLDALAEEYVRNSVLLGKVEELAPKAVYCDTVLQCRDAIPVSLIAKDYGMSAITFNKLLHQLGIQYRAAGTWLLYQKYTGWGYTQTRTYRVDEKVSAIHTCWTQKGRLFLYETLKNCGIIPLIEKRSIVM